MILKGTVGTCSKTDFPVVSSPKTTATNASIANLPLTLCSTEDVDNSRHSGVQPKRKQALTSGAGPVKAITSCMLSLSTVSSILPIFPVCTGLDLSTFLSSFLLNSAVHLRLAFLCRDDELLAQLCCNCVPANEACVREQGTCNEPGRVR